MPVLMPPFSGKKTHSTSPTHLHRDVGDQLQRHLVELAPLRFVVVCRVEAVRRCAVVVRAATTTAAAGAARHALAGVLSGVIAGFARAVAA